MDDLLKRIWAALADEFSDLADLEQATRVCARLLVAVILGGLLGYERESRGASAGLRTHMLVALGSALFMATPQMMGATNEELSRVLQGLIAGIGFLGAGAIIKFSDDQRIVGLTTAASIWMAAAIGSAVGMGREMTALVSTVFALVILVAMRRLERR